MNVEIWSDIACPWCYVGKRRFEAALERFEHRDQVHVSWRSFELEPDAPLEREGERAERLAQKYGMTVQQAREMEQQMTDVAAGAGLGFRFDIARSGNTFDAHRIVHLAEDHGLQDEMKERLMRGYLCEGELMSDRDALVRLATEVGLPADEVRETLAGERYAEEVRGDERTAQQFGIGAVPTFVVDRSIDASGAHPPEALLDLLRQGWAARPRAPIMAGGGESCGVEGC
jgi:predicted DsbA family dithiol-disulfide isomerase